MACRGALAHKATGFSAKLLRRTDQCRALLVSANLHWQAEDSPEPPPAAPPSPPQVCASQHQTMHERYRGFPICTTVASSHNRRQATRRDAIEWRRHQSAQMVSLGQVCTPHYLTLQRCATILGSFLQAEGGDATATSPTETSGEDASAAPAVPETDAKQGPDAARKPAADRQQAASAGEGEETEDEGQRHPPVRRSGRRRLPTCMIAC